MVVFIEGKIAEQKTDAQTNLPFPKVFNPVKDESMHHLLQNVKENSEFITEELHKHGALLFRGFPLPSAKEFNEFVEALGWEEMPYQGTAPRVHVIGRVWTANEGSLDHEIFFHHEMALYKTFPSKIFFYCEVAPPKGGETAIVQSHKITEHMESNFPEFVKKLKDSGLVHRKALSNGENDHFLGKTWQASLGTNDAREAEKRVEKDGGRLEWKEDGSAEIVSGAMEAIREFEGYEGKKMWFNYIPAAIRKEAKVMNKLHLGEGSEIPKTIIEECGRAMEKECVSIKWENGDVLVIDNMGVMHARWPSLPPRRVLVAVCK